MRLPTAVIGVLNILLIYGVARRLFGDYRWATLAAALLALSPAHFIFSRQALDYICPLPFVLGWLWCVLAALETSNLWLSLASGILLGVGFYSYVASWATMPLLLLITWAAHYQSGEKSSRASLAAAIGFAVPVLAAIAWLSFHPEMWRDLALRYSGYDSRRLSQVSDRPASSTLPTSSSGFRCTGTISTPRICSFPAAPICRPPRAGPAYFCCR
jgi:4-amino-4-deoxy-L-arabinose transferase-like glycosyltransferase